MTSTRYFAQYKTSQGTWKASSARYALTEAEAFAYIAQAMDRFPGTEMRVVRSTKTDGLVNQEVVGSPVKKGEVMTQEQFYADQEVWDTEFDDPNAA